MKNVRPYFHAHAPSIISTHECTAIFSICHLDGDPSPVFRKIFDQRIPGFQKKISEFFNTFFAIFCKIREMPKFLAQKCIQPTEVNNELELTNNNQRKISEKIFKNHKKWKKLKKKRLIILNLEFFPKTKIETGYGYAIYRIFGTLPFATIY